MHLALGAPGESAQDPRPGIATQATTALKSPILCLPTVLWYPSNTRARAAQRQVECAPLNISNVHITEELSYAGLSEGA